MLARRSLSLALGLAAVAACSGDPSPADTTGTSTTTTSGSGGGGGAACSWAPETVDPPPIHTPRWAFEPWISKDISDGADTYAFVKGFHERDIPVGAVVLDSPWETNYNTFVPNPTRYPDFAKMVKDLKDGGVHVVLWITPMVNSISYDLEKGGDTYEGASPNLFEGRDCNFFVEDGSEFPWWKGTGAAVDFFNPSAMAWWHRQQDVVLDAGIDGWKLDFGESYVRVPEVHTAKGVVPHQEYSEAYYRDFYAYGAKVRGKDFVTMVRAWDESYDFEGRFFARKEHAPVAWMGDNRRDWPGLADALDEMFRSAQAGYAVVGSDIGGYLDRDDKDLTSDVIPLDPAVFARWTALGALNPFMQLHGRANITPWTVPQEDDQITNIYRWWSKLHHAMVPFYYSLAEETYAGGATILRPVGDMASWAGDYRFMLGEALLVAPILDATGTRDVALPAGARWYDFWAPDAAPYEGGVTLAKYDATDLARQPLFVKAGAIVPLNVDDATTGLGTAASAGKLTVLVYPDAVKHGFALHDEDDALTTIEAFANGANATVTLSRALRTTLLRVRAEAAPKGVMVDGKAATMVADRAAFDAASEGYFHEAATRSVWVKVPAGDGARKVEIQ